MTIHTESHPVPTILLILPLLWNFDHGFPWVPLLLLLLQSPPPATAQVTNPVPPPPPDPFSKLRFDKSMAIVLVILVVVFFILGFLSVYTRQCAERRIRGRLDLAIPFVGSGRRARGLDADIIHTFPTFVYSTVKGLKIGRATLECAVCLNEFQDDETLRLIPQCSHAFHPDCIDVWLSSHSTCPVCRANLAPRSGDVSIVAIQIPNPDGVETRQPDPGSVSENAVTITPLGGDDRNGVAESPTAPLRSRSTGFGIASLFPRSHSTGHDSLVQPGENCERFTLRLPEEVRNQLVNSTLSRTKSCGVTFARQSSGRRGYRTRSLGSGRGKSYWQYERFGVEGRPDRWGFRWTPPFVSRGSSTRSTMDEVDVGERSSDLLGLTYAKSQLGLRVHGC